MITDAELREMMADVFRAQAEAAREIKETAQQMKETDRQMKETDRKIKQVEKQIGDLGNKFGSFTEGMALPSMEKILYEQFGLNDISPRRKLHLNGRSLEIDVLAYDNTGVHDAVFIVEIKSKLTQEGIEQILQTIADFPAFFPDLKNRKIYGLIAAVEIPDNLRAAVVKRGLYLARIHDENFKLLLPPNFAPTAFGPAMSRNGRRARAK